MKSRHCHTGRAQGRGGLHALLALLALLFLPPVLAAPGSIAAATPVAAMPAGAAATGSTETTEPSGEGTKASTPVKDTMAQRMQACTPCHGAEGRAARDGYYPRIAGKPAGYLYEQLRSFRDGRRNQASMTHLLSHLSDDYLKAMAQYFADLDLPYPLAVPSTAGTALMTRGETLVRKGDPAADLPSCTSCHGEAMTGREPGTPGLLGLPRDYLVAQIGAWQARQRRGIAPDCMAEIARRLKPDDVLAVTSWLTAQAVPAHAKAVADDGRELPLKCAPVGLPTAQTLATPSAVADGAGDGVGANRPAGAAGQAGGQASPQPYPEGGAAAAERIVRGAYLAQAGNCVGCHTARGGIPFAGGLGIETPFGSIYAGNLTPDAETGLGSWTAEDFRLALREGRSRDGRLLYPAFPYQNYGLLTDADIDDLFTFLKSLPPTRQPNRPHSLRFPYDSQLALSTWRALFFEPATYQPRPDQSSEWNRGDYLVRGLGHCDACHSTRNMLGAIRDGTVFDGGPMPGQSWYAPSLKSNAEAGVGDWSIEAIVALLRDGVSAHGSVTGPMAEVVATSTRHLGTADLEAMAIRLKTLAEPDADAGRRASAAGPSASDEGARRRGADIYRQHCADCHGKDGRGVAGIYPPLAGNRAVTLPVATNVIRIVAEGGFPPSTRGNPKPFGMPPFGQQLQSAQIADVVTYIRQTWGNEAAGVTPNDVTRARP